MQINLDQEFYIVFEKYRTGPFVPETDIASMTKEAVLNDLVSGQYEELLHVLYLNPAEGHSRDVSEDIAREWLGMLSDIEVDEYGAVIPEFIRQHHPDTDAIEREIIADHKLHQQSPERLYGCPARI